MVALLCMSSNINFVFISRILPFHYRILFQSVHRDQTRFKGAFQEFEPTILITTVWNVLRFDPCVVSLKSSQKQTAKTSFLISGGHHSFCEIIDTSVLVFWWHQLWFSKQGGSLLAFFLTCMQWIPQIHLWSDTFWPLDGQEFKNLVFSKFYEELVGVNLDHRTREELWPQQNLYACWPNYGLYD